jgi:hypothetical protein
MGNLKTFKKFLKTEKSIKSRKKLDGLITLAGEEGFEPSAYGFGGGTI